MIRKKVLAIDPGPTQSALVLWDGHSILYHAILENEQALWEIKTTPLLLEANALAIELIKSYGMAVSDTVFSTCIWIGRYQQHWYGVYPSVPIAIELIPRLTVKLHLTHRSNANDSNVSRAIKDRLGEPGNKKQPGKTYGIVKDEWAALGVALYYYDTYWGGQADES